MEWDANRRFRDDDPPHHRPSGAAGLGPYGLNASPEPANETEAPGRCYYTQAAFPSVRISERFRIDSFERSIFCLGSQRTWIPYTTGAGARRTDPNAIAENAERA